MIKLVCIGFFIFKSSFVTSQTNTLIPFVHDNKWGFSDTNLNIRLLPTFDYVSPFVNGFARVKKDSNWGLLDTNFQMVISIDYRGLYSSEYGFPFWGIKDTQSRLVSIDKIIKLNDDYSSVYRYSKNLFRVVKSGKFGALNIDGTEAIPCKYDSMGLSVREDRIAVMDAERGWGFINSQGKLVIDCKYTFVHDYREGLAAVMDSTRGWGFIDLSGNEVIPLKYQFASSFYEGFAYVMVNEKIGFIDSKERFLIKPEYSSCNYFQNGFAVVQTEKSSKVFNRDGKCVLSSRKYDDIDYFNYGLAAVEDRSGKCGYIDTTGKLIVPLKYDYSEEFSCGLGMVGRNKKYGYVDIFGKILIPLKYDKAYKFENDLAEVERNGKKFLIDTRGREYILW